MPILLIAICWLAFGITPVTRLDQVVHVQVINNLVYVRGAIDRAKDLNVILDTGSSVSIVDPQAAKYLALTPARAGQAAGIGRGASEMIHFVKGATLSIGGARVVLRDQQLGILSIKYIADEVGHPTDALFGGDFFDAYCITVDYQKRRVTFSRPGTSDGVRGATIPIQLHDGSPFVTAILTDSHGATIRANFLLDSGTTGALILSRPFIAAHPSLILNHRIVKMPPIKVIGGSVATSLIRVPRIRLDRFSFSGVIARVPQATTGVLANGSIAGFIGAGLLDRFTVAWDYQRGVIVLHPNARFSTAFETDGSGLELSVASPDYKTIFVRSVLPGSPAMKAGIREGDVIVSVNGQQRSLWQVTDALSHPGAQVVLETRRGEMRRQCVLHLQRFV